MSSQFEPVDAGNPYAAPSARIDDLQVAPTGELAPRGLRLGAAVIDMLSYMIPVVLFVVFFATMTAAARGAHAPSSPVATGIVVTILGLVVAVVAVVNIVFVVRYQQTIGKRMCRIKIVRSNGGRCSAARIIFLRGLLVGVLTRIPLVGPLFALVDPLLIFRDDHRCVHDHIADTIVVRA